MASPSRAADELKGDSFSWGGRQFVRATVPYGDNRGRVFTIAQPLGGRYQALRFFRSGGMGLLLEGLDLRTGSEVLIKSILRYDVVPYAEVRDQEGFTNQLRVPRKALEMERRILVLLRNAGCNAVPHPNDFVYDTNPLLAGPYTTEDRESWTYDDVPMLDAEPYLIMENVRGQSLEDVLKVQLQGKLSEARTLRIMFQVADVLATLHQPRKMRPGMTWQLIYQDLKPANLLVSEQDRVTVLDLGGCQILNLETGQKLLQGACTPGYCPPECERPYNILTPAADIYTVGSTFFHLLTGRSPLESLGANVGKDQVRAIELDLHLLEGICRPPLRRLLQRCLEIDPARRFPDAKTLKETLNDIMLTP
jgi:serine/threonine-protein kinase